MQSFPVMKKANGKVLPFECPLNRLQFHYAVKGVINMIDSNQFEETESRTRVRELFRRWAREDEVPAIYYNSFLEEANTLILKKKLEGLNMFSTFLYYTIQGVRVGIKEGDFNGFREFKDFILKLDGNVLTGTEKTEFFYLFTRVARELYK